MDILNKLQEIFREIFDDESLIITRDFSPSDIEDWDSMAQINIIVACEGSFGVKFHLNEVTELKNVGDIENLISMKLS